MLPFRAFAGPRLVLFERAALAAAGLSTLVAGCSSRFAESCEALRACVPEASAVDRADPHDAIEAGSSRLGKVIEDACPPESGARADLELEQCGSCARSDAACIRRCGACVDADRDGHASTSCGGDDCDDEQATVHPGAPELCDGLDNDCDRLEDLADGLPLGGTTREIASPAADASIAWATGANVFGVAWVELERQGRAAVHLSVLSKDGIRIGRDATVGATESIASTPKVASDPAGFGLVWTERRGGTPEVRFQRVGVDGQILGSAVLVARDAESPAIAYSEPGGFTVAYAATRAGYTHSGIYARRVSLESELESPEVVVTAGGEVNHTQPFVVSTDDATWIGWTEFDTLHGHGIARATSDPELVRLSSFGEPRPPDPETQEDTPVLAFTGGALATAWHRVVSESPAHRLVLEVRDPRGALLCGPSELAVDGARPLGVAGSASGTLVLLNQSGSTWLARFDGDCAPLGPPLAVPGPASDHLSGSLAASDTGFGALWVRWGTDTWRVEGRTLGPHLCD